MKNDGKQFLCIRAIIKPKRLLNDAFSDRDYFRLRKSKLFALPGGQHRFMDAPDLIIANGKSLIYRRTAHLEYFPLIFIQHSQNGSKRTMNAEEQIQQNIAALAEPKRSEMLALHELVLKVSPACKLWFDNGRNPEGKVIANPTAGYGLHTLRYANGKTKDWFRIGISANQTGISVYILGIPDKTYLPKTYGKKIGKASVTGYCIKFKTLKDIHADILETAIRDGFAQKP